MSEFYTATDHFVFIPALHVGAFRLRHLLSSIFSCFPTRGTRRPAHFRGDRPGFCGVRLWRQQI